MDRADRVLSHSGDAETEFSKRLIILLGKLPGSSPGGSRVIRRGDGVGVLGKKLFNCRYKERLEKDSVVGNISGEKRLNNLVYVENQ